MLRHVIRLFKVIHKLGLRNGSLLYYDYVYHRVISRHKWACKQVRIKTLSRPVWMRPGVSDWIVMERIFLDEEYDPLSKYHDKAMDVLHSAILASGKLPLIIDCGANIGLSSVWLAARFPAATVISVEPQPDNFKVLALNAKNYPNIIPVHAAISNRMSRVTLSNDDGAPWAWQTHESEAGDLPAVTISHLVSLQTNPVLMAVKVDIEGFEVNLLRDGAPWADDLPLLIFEMHDWMKPLSGSGHSFFSVLSKRQRDYLLHGENVFSYSHQTLEAAANHQ